MSCTRSKAEAKPVTAANAFWRVQSPQSTLKYRVGRLVQYVLLVALAATQIGCDWSARRAGTQKADADWKAKRAAVYSAEFPRVTWVGQNEVILWRDTATGFVLWQAGGHGPNVERPSYYDAYNARIQALIKAQGMPAWSPYKDMVAPDRLVECWEWKGLQKVEKYPFDVNENLAIICQPTYDRWGKLEVTGSDTVSIVSPHWCISGWHRGVTMSAGRVPLKEDLFVVVVDEKNRKDEKGALFFLADGSQYAIVVHYDEGDKQGAADGADSRGPEQVER